MNFPSGRCVLRKEAPAGCRLDESQALELLIRRCVGGDADAWEELVRQYGRRIYNICYRFTGSPAAAEDVTQDVFVRVYRTLGSFDPRRATFMTWLGSVTRNLLVDHFRKSKMDRCTDSLDTSPGNPDATPLAEAIPDERINPDTSVGRREARELVHQALQRLSPELREPVILRDLQELEYREIAQILKLPEGTVKSRINRGRTELARLLFRIQGQVG